MPQYLVSPAEPPSISIIGTSSSIPEQYGADIMWFEPVLNGFIGVQRKAVPDLLASLEDGRLAKEIAQLKDDKIKMSFLIIEGTPQWTSDGKLVDKFRFFTRVAWRSVIRSLQYEGIIVETTDNQADTVSHIESIATWCAKTDHNSLHRRPKPKPKASEWGSISDRAWASHLLQAIPMIGPKQADLILDHLNGRPLLNLLLTTEELASIKGLGPKKIEAIVKAFTYIEEKHGNN